MRVADTFFNERDDSMAVVNYKLVAYGATGELIFDSIAGRALHNMAVSAQSLGRATVVDYFESAIEVRDSVFSHPHNDKAKSRSSFGRYLLDENELDLAAHYLYTAHEVYAKAEAVNYRDWMRTLYFLIRLAGVRSDVDIGRAAADMMLNAYDAGKSEIRPAEQAAYLYNAGSTLYELKALDAAEKYIRLSIPIYLELDMRSNVADAYVALNGIAVEDEDMDLALSYLDTALQYSPEEQSESVSYIYHCFAKLYVNGGQLDLATSYLARAMEGLSESSDLHVFNAALSGLIADKRKRGGEALQLTNASLAPLDTTGGHLVNGILRIDPENAEAKNLRVMAVHLSDRAAFLTKQKRYAEALHDYQTLLSAREKERKTLVTTGSRARISASINYELGKAIALCYDGFQAEGTDSLIRQALRFSESSRAYGLLKGQKRTTLRAEREFSLRTELAKLQRKSNGGKKAKRRSTEIQFELDRMQHASADDDQVPGEFDLGQLRAQLGATDVTYYHLGERSFVFRLPAQGGSTEVHEITPDSLGYLSECVQAYRAAVRNAAYLRRSIRPPSEQAKLDREVAKLGHELATLLRWQPDGQNQLVVADGALHALPFAALPGSDGTKITYAYSLTSLLAQTERPEQSEQSVVAFAPDFAGSRFTSLPYNQREAAFICDAFDGSTLLSDGEANRKNFVGLAPRASILHLSTHAEANLDEPGLSYLALSQTGGDRDEDERIYYNELAAYPLSAELVVLSACETNVGRPAPGETVLSLATAFTAAGARSTLTTLWPVDDRVTYLFMTEFYTALRAGADRAEAFHRAQLLIKHSEDYHHVRHWAGFVLHGATGPLLATPLVDRFWWWLGLGAALLGLLIFMFALLRNSSIRFSLTAWFRG